MAEWEKFCVIIKSFQVLQQSHLQYMFNKKSVLNLKAKYGYIHDSVEAISKILIEKDL